MRDGLYGSLRVRITGGVDREGGGTGPLVVLLHGFGAPGTDLVPLYRQLEVPHEVRFAFPEAPLDLASTLGAGYAGARAWWMIDVAALAQAASGEAREDRSSEEPPGLESARGQVIDTIAALEADLAVPPGKLVLGGFSQGAMLSLDVALSWDHPLAALALMSGTLLARERWALAMPRRAGTPTLVSHGRADPLLPFAAAETVRDLLSAAGLATRWVPFSGGHTITDGVLKELGRLISDVA